MADTTNSAWNRAERDTPKQTSDRITGRMQANAKAAQRDKKN
jgi:hypothetical protein